MQQKVEPVKGRRGKEKKGLRVLLDAKNRNIDKLLSFQGHRHLEVQLSGTYLLENVFYLENHHLLVG